MAIIVIFIEQALFSTPKSLLRAASTGSSKALFYCQLDETSLTIESQNLVNHKSATMHIS